MHLKLLPWPSSGLKWWTLSLSIQNLPWIEAQVFTMQAQSSQWVSQISSLTAKTYNMKMFTQLIMKISLIGFFLLILYYMWFRNQKVYGEKRLGTLNSSVYAQYKRHHLTYIIKLDKTSTHPVWKRMHACMMSCNHIWFMPIKVLILMNIYFNTQTHNFIIRLHRIYWHERD